MPCISRVAAVMHGLCWAAVVTELQAEWQQLSAMLYSKSMSGSVHVV